LTRQGNYSGTPAWRLEVAATTAKPTHVGRLPSQVRSQSTKVDFASVGAVSNRQQPPA